MIHRLIATLLLLSALPAGAQESKPPQLTPEEQKLAAEAVQLDREAIQLHQRGQAAEAVVKARGALEIHRKLYPPAKYPDGHLQLADSINNLGAFLQAMGSNAQALPYFEQALAMNRKLFPAAKYPDGHAQLATSINNMGFLLNAMGSYDKALPYFEQALAMTQKLYPASEHPNGHPRLASSLNNLGALLQALGSYETALPRFEQALAMRQKLYPASMYPDGHADLARSITNLGFLLHTMGLDEKALPYYEQALAMNRKLNPVSKYPDGHPSLALSINHLGFLMHAMGSYEKALSHFEQALAMTRTLYPEPEYPDGHPHLADNLNNLGGCLQAMGSYEKALPHFEQALTMYRTLGRRLLATASEVEALAFVNAQPRMPNGFLSLTNHLPNSAASAYGSVWSSKSAITRVLEQRHASARVAGTDQAGKFAELKGLRRRIDQLLQDRRLPAAERDRLLTKATDDRDLLERELAKALPMLQRDRELDALDPEALGLLLPDHAALIDFVRYARFDYDRSKPGIAHESRTPCYTAFVLVRNPVARAPGSALSLQRIELGEAKPIDRAVAQWRAAIEARTDSPAANQVRDLVWAKLAPHLPAGITTLYLAPDGDLARMPWAALPVAANRVLLEDYALATVPHGPFLLDHLKFPRAPTGPDSLLTLGGVNYGSAGIWPALPGTAVEVNAIGLLAATPHATLTKTAATATRLTDVLPTMRYAHLATHGAFKTDDLAAEKKRADAAMQARQFGDPARQVASTNPLGYVGLVLAGGEVMSGLSIVDLPLENLRLVTLSACETGLGEYTGGEGVQGLQRAFHLAGCPNVVASLWKVNDAATAALMAKFYHELWVNKKPPIEALREAQLTIYRRPDLIATLASAERGIKLEQALNAKSDRPAETKGTTPTKLWAAFVLSGAGK